MKEKITHFILGFMSACLILGICYLMLNSSTRKKNPYFILNKDYRIGENGLLKKGTRIQIDQGMDEGFTRFILYLNLKGGNITKDSIESDIIIPYWLYE